MWIFRNDAFVSIVEDRDMPDQLWVRGRIRGDVERFLGALGKDVEVIETPDADYRYRAPVNRELVALCAFQSVERVDYPNFKGSIPTDPVSDERHHTYLRVWTAMMAFQRWCLQREARIARKRKKKAPKGY